jgi:hypothetical protein
MAHGGNLNSPYKVWRCPNSGTCSLAPNPTQINILIGYRRHFNARSLLIHVRFFLLNYAFGIYYAAVIVTQRTPSEIQDFRIGLCGCTPNRIDGVAKVEAYLPHCSNINAATIWQ